MPDAESPFRIGHFPYPYYPRTRILSGDITVQWINTGGGLKQKHKKTAFWRCQRFAPVVSVAACLISSQA